MNTTTNTRGVSEAMVTHQAAAKALDSLDDYARMGTGVDAHGPRGVLERYIAQQSATCPPTYRREEAVKALIGKGWTWDGKAWAEPAAQGAVCPNCGAPCVKQRVWDEAGGYHTYQYTAPPAEPAAQGEAVAVIGADFTIHWVGTGPIAPIIEKHGLKVGDKLYATAVAEQQSMNEPSGNSGELAQGEAVAWAQFEEGQLVALAFKRSQEAGCTTPLYTDPPAQPAERVPEERYRGVPFAVLGKAFQHVLADPRVVWRDNGGAQTFIDRVQGETAAMLTASPAPSEGEKGVDRG